MILCDTNILIETYRKNAGIISALDNIARHSRVVISNEIRKHLTDQQRSVAWLAAQLHHDPSNLRKLLKNSYMPTDLLFRISTILGKDFFAGYSALLAENAAAVLFVRNAGRRL